MTTSGETSVASAARPSGRRLSSPGRPTAGSSFRLSLTMCPRWQPARRSSTRWGGRRWPDRRRSGRGGSGGAYPGLAHPVGALACLAVARASGGMADALASGASIRKDVGVQVPPRPPHKSWSEQVKCAPRTPTSTGLLPGRPQCHSPRRPFVDLQALLTRVDVGRGDDRGATQRLLPGLRESEGRGQAPAGIARERGEDRHPRTGLQR